MKTKSNRTGLMITTTICGILSGLVPAMMATSASADEAAPAESVVVVTGSRLKVKDYKAISPVSTVTSETIALTATTSVERLLNELPQITPGNTYTSNNAGGEDFSTIDLRGLSPTRTLVLVNGERVPGSSTTGAVDVGAIPTSLIERVELVTGGASAVYGSDAIAGVVNFIMKKNFQGAETNISYGSNFDGRVPEFNWDGLIGGNFNNGKGNVTAYASYYERKGVFQSAFDYSKNSAGVVGYYDLATSAGTGVCIANTSAQRRACEVATPAGQGFYNFASGGSGTPPWGNFSSPGNSPVSATVRTNPLTSGTFGSVDHDCNPATANITTQSAAAWSFNAAGKVAPNLTGGQCRIPDRAAGSSRYNYAPDNYLVIPGKRYAFNTTFNYELSPHARLSGMVNYVNSESVVQLAPTPATGLTVKLTPAMQAMIQANHADLWSLLQTRANPLGDITANRRTSELGPRIGTNTNNAFMALATLAGDFSNDWDYSITTSYGHTRFTNRLQNNAGLTQFKQGLAGCQNMDGSAITGLLPNCVPLDIFGAGTISAAGVKFLGVDTSSSTTVTESRLSAFTRGNLFEVPAGTVSAVFGYEYRKSTAVQLVDDAQKNGDIYGFNATQNQAGKISVNEVYGELSVPIVKDLPFAKSVNLELGYRTSEYSTVGRVETYKYAGDWSPVEWLRVRAAHNRAVRAPNVFELFQNGDQGFPTYTDPCNDIPTRSAATSAFCITQGVPAGSIVGFAQTNSQVQAFAFGNPNLTSETSDSDTYGVVFQPDWFPVGKLKATVDYYHVHIADAISDRGATTILGSCYSNLGSAGQSAADCTRIRRDVNGQVVGVDTSRGNLTFFDLKGTDVSVAWQNNVFGGVLGLKYDATFTDSYNFGGTEYVDTTSGTVGSAIPKSKHVVAATFKTGPFTYFGRWLYTPEIRQDYIGSDYQGSGAAKTPAASYLDLSMKWDVNSNLSFLANVSNVLDELPPQTATGVFAQSNTDVQTYRILGRTFNVAAKYRF